MPLDVSRTILSVEIDPAPAEAGARRVGAALAAMEARAGRALDGLGGAERIIGERVVRPLDEMGAASELAAARMERAFAESGARLPATLVEPVRAAAFETADIFEGAAERMGRGFERLFDGVLRGGIRSFEDLRRTAHRTLDQIGSDIARAGLRDLLRQQLSWGGGTGGPAIAPLGGGLLGGLIGFQSGGAFTVPGAGPPDSRLVAFRATPGERVTIDPRPRAREAPAAAQTVNVTMHVATPDARSFLAARSQIEARQAALATRSLRRNG